MISHISALKIFRVQDWWHYKVAHILTLLYLAGVITQLRNVYVMLFFFSGLLLYFFFMASFGFFINEMGDVACDLAAGKVNQAFHFTSGQRISIVLFLFFGVCLSTAILNAGWISWACIILQVILFITYSFQPTRFKESSFGVLLDAHYANIIPMSYVISILWRYFDLANHISAWQLIILYVWQLTLGLRDIITHQLSDKVNDEKSKTSTFVRRFNDNFVQLLVSIFLPAIELLLFISLLIVFSCSYPELFILPLCYGCYVLCILYKLHFVLKSYVGFPPHPHYWIYLTNNFYNNWLPLISILLLIIYCSWHFIFLLIIHLMMFGMDKVSATAKKAFIYEKLILTRNVLKVILKPIRSSMAYFLQIYQNRYNNYLIKKYYKLPITENSPALEHKPKL